jgi:hypothetical protein
LQEAALLHHMVGISIFGIQVIDHLWGILVAQPEIMIDDGIAVNNQLVGDLFSDRSCEFCFLRQQSIYAQKRKEKE